MFPVNQVILGGSDPLLGSSTSNMNIDDQLRLLERQKQLLEEAQQKQLYHSQQSVNTPKKLIWDEIDNEVMPLTDEQKSMLFQDPDYADTYNKIQALVQSEIINIVKSRIENTAEGRELLNTQLKIVKKLKGKIIDTTNKEMEMFRKFKEYSKQHPEVTYDEFIKSVM